jgi:hypothetical protein
MQRWMAVCLFCFLIMRLGAWGGAYIILRRHHPPLLPTHTLSHTHVPPPSHTYTRTHAADSLLTMDDFTDTTWLETARASLLGNADLVRLIGDERVLGILSNPDMVPRKPSQFPDPESLLESW